MIDDDKKDLTNNEGQEDDILQIAVDYMGSFIQIATKIVSEFREGDYSRLMSINELFEGFQWIHMAILKIQSEYNAEIPIDSDRVQEALASAVEALKNSDAVLITDIIEYDIIEMVREWYGSE